MPGTGLGLGIPLGGTLGWTPMMASVKPSLWLKPESLGNPNRLIQTADLENVAWTAVNVTITSGQSDPDGGNNAFLVTPDGGAWPEIYQSALGFQAGDNDRNSVWWKRGPSHTGVTNATLRGTDGVGNHDSSAVPPVAWERVSVTTTLDGAADKSRIELIPEISATPTVTNDIYFYHPQLEAGVVTTGYHANVATAGGIVAQWDDSSLNGNHCTQGAQASMPLVVADALNGKSAALFDGVDDEMVVTGGIDLAAGFEIWVVCYVSANAADRRIFAKTDASDRVYLDSAHKISTDIDTDTDLISNAVSTGQFSLLAWRRDASDNLTAEEGGTDVTNGTPSEAGTVTLNSLSDGADLFDEKLVEVVVVSGVYLAADRTNMLAYFNSKYPGL